METTDLQLRPVRPADRDRVREITRDVWEGRDYIPRVFDSWVSDAGASFQAAEIDDAQRIPSPDAPAPRRARRDDFVEDHRPAGFHLDHVGARVRIAASLFRTR